MFHLLDDWRTMLVRQPFIATFVNNVSEVLALENNVSEVLELENNVSEVLALENNVTMQKCVWISAMFF